MIGRTLLASVVLASAMSAHGLRLASARSPRAVPPDVMSNSPAVQTVRPASVTLAEFRRLRWIAGSWQGAEVDKVAGAQTDEVPFFEDYRFVNDSTIQIRYFSDPRLKRPTGTGRVELRGGQVHHVAGPSRWVATRVDSANIEFAPVAAARNRVTWARTGPNDWMATLILPGDRQVTYRMTRLKR